MQSNQTSVHTSSYNLAPALRALLLVLPLVLAGCASRERFETSGGGHQIVGDVEGPQVVIESRETHAAVSSPFGNVTIERDRAQIDQAGWVKIPENIPVKMSISKHKVSIRAGAVSMTRTIN